MWSLLQKRVKGYTKEGVKHLATFSLPMLLFVTVLLAESLIAPYYGARTAIWAFITAILLAIFLAAPMLCGLLLAWILRQDPCEKQRETVLNFVSFLLLGIVLATILYAGQSSFIAHPNALSTALREGLLSYRVDMNWLLFIDAFLIWMEGAFLLREEL